MKSDEEGPYKPVPPPKPVQNNQKSQNYQSLSNDQQPLAQTSTLSAARSSGQESLVHNTGQSPEYRMPPLYGEDQNPSQIQQSANLQTHSSKFPIEREVVLSSSDKNSKIPILHEYKQRTSGRVAIAPDAPVKQQAWVQEGNQLQELRQEVQRGLQSQENYSTTATGAVPRTSKIEEERTKSLSRTYHTIKDMISSRFGPNRKDVDAEPEASLNNVAEELRKSSRSINEEEAKKKEGIYGKPRAQDPPVNMQQYPKNSYGQYGHSYGYQTGQQSVPLPGQLQAGPPIQPSLPGQSAQLHVSHHTPAGVQTVHQTQIGSFPQTPGGQQVQSVNREYVVPGPGAVSSSSLHQGLHQTVAGAKHGLSMQSQAQQQVYQSPQQLLHQNQLHQSPRFAQQHAQNMHQRQIIQQMHQQQIQAGQQTPQAGLRTGQQFTSGYQQYQARQPISRSQIDLPSTSRQTTDVRIQSQEVYYHYSQGRPRYGIPQVYMKTESNQDVEFQRRNSAKRIEKAASQPQLNYEDERPVGADKSDLLDKEKYEITVEDRQAEFARNGSQRKEEYRPETSFGIRREELRASKRDQDYVEESKDSSAVQKRVEELQKRGETSYSPKLSKESLDNDIVRNTTHNTSKRIDDKRPEAVKENPIKGDTRRDDLDQGMSRLKIQNQGSGSDYDKAGQSSSNVDSGRGSAVYSSGRRPPPEDQGLPQGQDSEWVDIVESELRSILEPRDVPAMAHSTLSESVSSVTPPLPPLSPHGSPRTPRNRYTASLPYGTKPNYSDYGKGTDKRSFPSTSKHRGASTTKKEAAKKFSHLFGVEAADLTSTTTGLDLDSMLDRSDSDLSTNDARTIRKQLEGLESMYSEVLKLLGGSVKKRRKARGLASYGSVSSLPTSSVSSRPVTRHHDKRRSHIIDDRMKKAKDIKSINKRFQRLESHVVTLARSVAHLSSEMRTQHLMIQEMENIRGEIAALRTQTSMAMVRSQSQPLIKDSELPALSNPSRVKKLTKFFGTEPPLIRLFLRELGYEKYANAFEKEKVGMVELPYLSEERLQKMGVPLGPRLRILQEARISVCKDPVYVV
ncbi:uncharacterized protein LOC107263917 isoform X3 [Cephus cinctus]|uniref:Uncharacterized protein LOC107263917 isoform X3 n=1 Tax=Cephus cinctus TaxID=211228 RepID=A0AAJ7FE06_CEPCN|nr:uncharacterized protein LOC107263917 isoform X3 [Cephus cinctus]XP_015587078.1 uncharacterized protein LOC107263917 isoform X3 [Cephus cinctus]XP_015587079.1 uncharacterized protein LOC107263917 isoform X3 [Cephus cinctus]